MQEQLGTLSNYADDSLVDPFQDDLGYIADLAHTNSHQRYQLYRERNWRCSNHRARFIELQAYDHFAPTDTEVTA